MPSVVTFSSEKLSAEISESSVEHFYLHLMVHMLLGHFRRPLLAQKMRIKPIISFRIFQIVHRRLGARNVLLVQTQRRLVAKVFGFGPMGSETAETSKVR